MYSIKLIASQAKCINEYKKLGIKVLKCCANIYFNRQCLKQDVVPKYANIKIPYTSTACKATHRKAQTVRIKEEIKLLYKKKERLNTALYNTHLQAAKEWGNSWHLIHQSILNTTNQESEKKYKNLDEKISRLVNVQKPKLEDNKHFYPRVINKTEIDFSKEELGLLHTGLKYNLGHKRKHWVNNLAFEAESAISLLPPGEQEHVRYQVAQNTKKTTKSTATKSSPTPPPKKK
jgi:hypothetical protein